MLLIIIHYAFFALTLTGTKMIFGCCKPIFYTATRFALAGALLMAYQYWYTKERFFIAKEHLWTFAQISFFGIYFTYIIRFWGLMFLSSANGMFMFNLAPFATALMSYVLLHERMTQKQWLGLAIAFLGFIPVIKTSSITAQSTGSYYLPEIAVLASVATQSYTWILVRKLLRETCYSPGMINGISMFFGGLCALITAPFFEGWYPVTDTIRFLELLIFVTFIGSIVCQTLYTHLLKVYTATFMSFAGFMSPFFAAFYGWMWLNENTSWHFYASCIIVFAGLVLFYQDELKAIRRDVPDVKMPEMLES